MLKRLFWILLLALIFTPVLLWAVFSPTVDLLGRPLRVPDQRRPADVVVAVSAGLLRDCKAHPNLFMREHYGAMLLRLGFSRSGKLIISGLYSRGTSEEVQACQRKMADFLKVRPDQLIMDNASETTADNARNIQRIMARHHWRNAVLVTSRSHMRRAMWAFQKQGVQVYPVSIADMPPLNDQNAALFHPARFSHIKRFLYEYGALFKYKWYGYI